MSNSRFRVAEKAAPEARAELLAQAKRFELINAAIERLFAKRGEQVIAQMEPEERERMKAAAIEVNKRLSPEQMRELSAAVADLDTNKLMDFVAKQPNDLRELIHEAVFGAKKKQKANSPQVAMAS